MQHQNGGVMTAFLFDTLLADGHLDDIIEFSFSMAVMKVFFVRHTFWLMAIWMISSSLKLFNCCHEGFFV